MQPDTTVGLDAGIARLGNAAPIQPGPKIEPRPLCQALRPKHFDELPVEMKLRIASFLGRGAKDMTGIMFANKVNATIFPPLAAIAAARDIRSLPIDKRLGKFEKLLGYFLQDISKAVPPSAHEAPGSANKRNCTDGLAALAEQLGFVQPFPGGTARFKTLFDAFLDNRDSVGPEVIVALAGSVRTLIWEDISGTSPGEPTSEVIDDRAEWFQTMFGVVRTLPVAHRGEALASLAGQLDPLRRLAGSTKRFYDVFHACCDLPDKHSAAGFLALAGGLHSLPQEERVAAFHDLLTAIRERSEETDCAAGLAVLAENLRHLPEAARTEAAQGIADACVGLQDQHKVQVLKSLAGSIECLPPPDAPQLMRFMIACARCLDPAHRGGVLAVLAQHISRAPAQFDMLLAASLELPSIEERAEVLLNMGSNLSQVADLAAFRAVLQACDDFPKSQQPRIVAALARSAGQFASPGMTPSLADLMADPLVPASISTRYDACAALLQRSDGFDPLGQSVAVTALAASILKIDDPHWACEMFDAVMQRSANLSHGLPGAARLALAQALTRLPSSEMLDRFRRLGGAYGSYLRHDAEFRAALRLSVDSMNGESQSSARYLLRGWAPGQRY
ncbi:MAG TPA: hypothetical protein VF169_04730 [Albitalea sp.]|uniref:hypothetical protein n=1 Tax=Piscinibacter sp. TaxID=1903157 RepID=UPI002ED2A5B7